MVQYGRHGVTCDFWAFRCDWSKLKYAIKIKYTRLQRLGTKKYIKLLISNSLYWFTCWNKILNILLKYIKYFFNIDTKIFKIYMWLALYFFWTSAVLDYLEGSPCEGGAVGPKPSLDTRTDVKWWVRTKEYERYTQGTLHSGLFKIEGGGSHFFFATVLWDRYSCWSFYP